MSAKRQTGLSNHEIVTLAVYVLGGDSERIDTEDVAKKANELAPGRFTWRKYPDQVNIENVRTFLSDAKKSKNGGYLMGAGKDGWILTQAGLAFAKGHLMHLGVADLSRKAMSPRQRNWMRHERGRMLASDAFQKFADGASEAISQQEAEAFFRLDAYVTGDARQEKILRAKNLFGDDPEIGPLVSLLETLLSKGVHA